MKISNADEGEGQDFAKKLLELYDGGNKRRFDTNHISDAFPWMVQLGLMDYRKVYSSKGGWRLMLRRRCADSEAVNALRLKPPVIHGAIQWPKEYTPDGNAIVAKKIKKKCCDEPRPVRSKKTGKRKCKNCGAKLKSKSENR